MIEDGRLYWQNDKRVPMTYLSIVFHGAGFQQEDPSLMGLGRMAARTLFRGTPGMTREQISKQFDLLGANVEANVSETDFVISVTALSSGLGEALELVRTVAAEADFPQAELDLVRTQELNIIESSLQDPDRVLSSANEYALFGKKTMGKFGSRAALARITRDEVRAFYRKAVSCRTMYWTCISDLDRERIESEMSRFSRSRDGFSLKPETEFTASSGLEATIVQSPGASNDRLIWSHRGITATDDRRFDLSLIIDALGSFEGFLFDELRNKNGWCYGAYAYVMPATTRPGRIAYYADPSSDTSAKLIPAMLKLIRTFPAEAGFTGRLAERNTTFKNRYAYQLDMRKKLANEVNRDRYGIPILNREEYNGRIDRVTAATAGAVIRDVFDPDNMTLVFTGEAERIAKTLKGIGGLGTVSVIEKETLVA